MKDIFQNRSFQIWAGLSVVLGLFIFFRSASFPFLINYDDGPLIINNLAVIQFNLNQLFGEFVYGLYHPITSFSFAIDNILFNGNPTGFHWVNILLHFLNGILAYSFVLNLSKSKITAGITLLLFVIHPMHVESVVWLSERKDLLYTFFFLSGCLTYLKALKTNNLKWHILTFLLFVLSVLSKSAAVVFPLVLLLIDYCSNRFSFSKSILKTLPYFVVSIIFGVINIKAQQSAGFITELPDYSIYERVLLFSYSFAYYVVNFIVPINLSPKHFYPLLDLEGLSAAYSVAPIILLLFLFILKKSIQQNRLYLFGLLFFLITLVLVLKVIPTGNDIVSDRYSYLPYLGLSMFVGLLIERFYNKERKMYFILIGSIVVFVFTAISYSYTQVWENELSLWSQVIEKNPNHPVAWEERGRNYLDKSKFKKALADLNKSLSLDTTSSIAFNHRGLTLQNIEKPELAFNDYSKALLLDSNYAAAYSNRGVLLSKYGRTEEGVLDLEKAISLAPTEADYYNNLGIAYAQLSNWEKAGFNFNMCLKLNPNHSDALLNSKRLKEMNN